jgi:regulator of replication initiation timing
MTVGSYMPKVNITEAAKLAGITRQYLHTKYVKTGRITVEKDAEGKNPQIDTSEIMRVFGKMDVDKGIVNNNSDSYHQMTLEKDSINNALQLETQLLREQLAAAVNREAAAAEREKWMQGKIDQLADQLSTTTRLLEHRPPAAPPAPPKKQRWWQF